MILMSLGMHVAALALLILDLVVGGWTIERFGGEWALTAFEFLLILGYIIFVLQWGAPWGRREERER